MIGKGKENGVKNSDKSKVSWRINSRKIAIEMVFEIADQIKEVGE